MKQACETVLHDVHKCSIVYQPLDWVHARCHEFSFGFLL